MAKSQKEGTTWNKQTPVCQGFLPKTFHCGRYCRNDAPAPSAGGFQWAMATRLFLSHRNQKRDELSPPTSIGSIDIPQIIHFQRWSLTLRPFSLPTGTKAPPSNPCRPSLAVHASHGPSNPPIERL